MVPWVMVNRFHCEQTEWHTDKHTDTSENNTFPQFDNNDNNKKAQNKCWISFFYVICIYGDIYLNVTGYNVCLSR